MDGEQEGAVLSAGQPVGEAAQPTEGGTAQQQADGAQKPEKKPDETTDWKAKLAETQAALDKVQAELAKERNDKRSRDIFQLKSEQRDLLLQQLAEGQQILAEAIAKGENEGLTEKLAAAQQRHVNATQTASLKQALAEAQSDLVQVAEELGTDLKGLDRMPEMENARLYFTKAKNDGDPADFTRAVGEAQLAAAKLLRERDRKQHQAELSKAREEARKKALVDTEALDVETGASAGGGAHPSLENLVKTDTRRMTPKQLEEHGKLLDEAIRRGR